MITGFIENSWPKSHGSRMLPTAMWTRKGTSSAMTHLYGARLSRKMMGTTSSVEMVGPRLGTKLRTKVASATKRASGKATAARTT